MRDYDLIARTNAIERRVAGITREQSADERDALAAAHARADSVARQFGTTASQPVPGETPTAYRKRLLTPLMEHSERFRGARLDGCDAPTLDAVEGLIIADALAAARRSESYPPGQLRAIQERDESGRLVTKYVGDPMAWMAPYMTGAQVGYVVDPRNRKR